MSEGIVTFLITKLGDFLLEREKELETVKNEVEYVSDELAFMKAFTRLADAMEESYASPGDNGVRNLFTLRGKYVALLRMRAGVELLQKFKSSNRVISITESHRRYCNKNNIMVHGSSSDSTTRIECQRDALLLEEADLVGIEKPKKQLIERLLGTKSGLEVVFEWWEWEDWAKQHWLKRVYDDQGREETLQVQCLDHFVSQSYKAGGLFETHDSTTFSCSRKPDPHGVEEMDYDKLMMIINKFLDERKY
ncbi:hypothetical protein OIU76_004258 [Salix suchowensis]|nr:hypothetical protein OIU76_004258 [Salix suchowensis]